MQRQVVDYKPLPEERETVIIIHEDIFTHKEIAEIDTNIRKHINRCIKQGWEQVSETVYKKDGSIIAGTFKAPAAAISILKAKRPQLSDVAKQRLKDKAIQRMKNSSENE